MRILSSSVEKRLLNQEFVDFRAESVAVDPPLTKRGGTSSTPLSPLPLVCLQKTRIDWLAFTSDVGLKNLKILVACLFNNAVFSESPVGLKGYPSAINITVDDVNVGVIGYGAKAHNRDYVSISGVGCQLWENEFYPHVLDVLETAQGKISRIDICVDFYNGELKYQHCEDAYFNNWFKLPKSPKNPGYSRAGSGSGDLVNLGRTFYVGSRKGSKFVRCYEKGLEVFSRCSEKFREACTDPAALVWGEKQGAPEGTIADNWFRVEIEFKSKDVFLPLDMITDTDRYFAGASPFCSQVIGMTDGLRPTLLPKLNVIDNERMFQNMRLGYGNAVHTWLECGYTPQQIIQRLDTGVNNQKMVKAGILAQHQAKPDFDIPF